MVHKKLTILSLVLLGVSSSFAGYYRIRFVSAKDRIAPIINMDSKEITVSCKDSDDALLRGITAQDARDGDVTENLLIESLSNFTEDGYRIMTVAAFDSSNNAVKASRKVRYNDYRPPEFSLTEALRFPLNSTNLMGTLTAADVLDGDLTDNIKITSEEYIETDEVGTYAVTYSVSNSAGDVEKLPVTVEIYDPSEEYLKPQIVLDDYLVYTEVGTSIEPWDYVKSVTMNNTTYEKVKTGVLKDRNAKKDQERIVIEEEEMKITDNVNYEMPGVYEVVYRMTDDNSQSKETGITRLIVIVKERG
jgi:hypothetical protein